jgi:hypothetical protein
MMYLKQFPDICREMGLTVNENSKIVTLSIPDICYSIAINKKLFLEDLELVVDSFNDVHEAIVIFEAEVNAGKFNDMDTDNLQRLQSIFEKAKETGRLKDDTGLFQTEVGFYAQHAECLKAVLEKLLEKLKKEVDKARFYSTSSHDFPIVMKQIDASCYKAYVPTKSNNGFIVHEYIFDLDDIGKNDEQKIRAQFDELFQKTNAADSYRLLAELAIEVGYFVPACGIFFKSMGDAVSYIKAKTGVDLKVVQPDKTNLDMIRTVDKFHLAMLLNHICADSKNRPSSTTGWCEWLGNNWNSMT